MPDKTIREIGGEVWAEIHHTCNFRLGEQADMLRRLKEFDFTITHAFVDLMMAVLARYEGLTIVNDVDLPVEPLDYIHFYEEDK